jgi:murein DD-endopeptidase MepM/ murein hydrolase activator NlpD
MSANVKGGFTYRGEKLTHDTDGLPGYPAIDMFAKPGTPFLAPENGRIIRLSGRGGTSGNVYGWSVYFQGESGRRYFITHLNKQRAPRGARLKAGQPIGTVSAWSGGDPHAHVGIREPRRRR